MADLLGIDAAAGRPIDLTGVGESRVDACVHELTTRLDDNWPELKVPFAIAEVETVPNLLGRLGVFDLLQVDFDPSLLETRLTPRWLDDGDRELWNWIIEAAQHIRTRIPRLGWPLPAKEAVARLLSRAALLCASMAGLAKLHRTYSGPLFVRAIFEAAAQFEFMMQSRDQRAQDYIDFSNVTRMAEQDAALNAPPGLIPDTVRQSHLRKEGEKLVNSAFDRVEAKFRTKTGRLHKNWYRTQFRRLIEQLPSTPYDWMTEHDRWYKRYSAWAHADPFSTAQDDPKNVLRASDWLIQCYPYYARMLLRVADDGNLVLTSEQDSGLRGLAKGLK